MACASLRKVLGSCCGLLKRVKPGDDVDLKGKCLGPWVSRYDFRGSSATGARRGKSFGNRCFQSVPSAGQSANRVKAREIMQRVTSVGQYAIGVKVRETVQLVLSAWQPAAGVKGQEIMQPGYLMQLIPLAQGQPETSVKPGSRCKAWDKM